MGILYIVATPIGNLEDISLRAIRILKEVDLIACEDTRHSRILLDKYQIQKPLVSYHAHSQLQKVDYLVSELKNGKKVALISDAGTPTISDPGHILVEKARKNEVTVVSVPGASSVSAALAVSGFSGQKFIFLGFLPKKKGRKTLFDNLRKSAEDLDIETLIIFESPYRAIETLKDFQAVLGDVAVAVCRELTKKFEEIFCGKISEAIAHFSKKETKGEFVMCFNLKM